LERLLNPQDCSTPEAWQKWLAYISLVGGSTAAGVTPGGQLPAIFGALAVPGAYTDVLGCYGLDATGSPK
jgi:hypothetical protein